MPPIAANRRKILCIFPAYSPSFGTFENAYPLKRRLLALYRSERGNLRHVRTALESLRPLPRHDYTRPPHAGTLFRERFHWVPFRHRRVDFERTGAVLAALQDFALSAPAL